MTLNLVTQIDGLVTPVDIQAAYNVPGPLDGTGQTIAIIMCAVPAPTDLTTFWSNVGITCSGTATYTVIYINDGILQRAHAREPVGCGRGGDDGHGVVHRRRARRGPPPLRHPNLGLQ